MFDRFMGHAWNLTIVFASINSDIGIDTAMRNIPVGIIRSLRVMHKDGDGSRQRVHREEKPGAGGAERGEDGRGYQDWGDV